MLDGMENVRHFVRNRLKELDKSLTEASLAIGKNQTYIQQYIQYSKPQHLPERVRIALAGVLGTHPNELRDGEEPPMQEFKGSGVPDHAKPSAGNIGRSLSPSKNKVGTKIHSGGRIIRIRIPY